MPRIVITAPSRNPQPYRFQLDRQSVSIGRGSENDIIVEDTSVSVSHAAMERIEGGYQLRDLGSTNGIKLDGKKSEIIPLRHGLSVKVGDVAFDFTLTDDERAALNREKPEEQSPIVKEDELDALDPDGPRKATPPVRVPTEIVYQNAPHPLANFVMTVLFLALAGAAFFIGMSLKYKKTHDTSLWGAMHPGKEKAVSPDEAPAADAPAGATDATPPADPPKKPE
jgi:pSer/pThr/pTyr-binding forkhead associated (FHA) protein